MMSKGVDKMKTKQKYHTVGTVLKISKTNDSPNIQCQLWNLSILWREQFTLWCLDDDVD